MHSLVISRGFLVGVPITSHAIARRQELRFDAPNQNENCCAAAFRHLLKAQGAIAAAFFIGRTGSGWHDNLFFEKNKT